MTSKWNTDGTLNFADTNVLYAADLNDTGLATPPIGSMMPWLKSLAGVPQTLPTGWVQCDGQTLSDADSPLNGQSMPALNAGNRMLRGSTTSGTTGGADTHNHGTTSASGGGHGATGSAEVTAAINHTHTTSTEYNIPPYFDVVFIIRVK